MNVKKRIKDTPISTSEFCDEFYNIYRKPIDWFFGERKEETIYIKDEETVEEIENLLVKNSSNILYLIGKAGIGKTTLIKNEYGLSDNTTVFHKERGMVFASLGFRGKFPELDLTKFLASNISSICDSLEEEFDIGDNFYSMEGQLQFYEFVKETFAPILGYAKKTELIGKNSAEIKMFKLDKAEEHNKLSYEASRLKYYLLKYSGYYKKIVLVVDNMEAIEDNLRIQVVQNMLSLFSCILNVPKKEKDKMPSVDLILSMRDTTYMTLMKVDEIVAYHPKVIIRQVRPVDLFSYLENKHKEMRCAQEEELLIWEEMYEIIQNFIRKFANKYSAMIRNLSNYDFSVEKSIYKRIFTNKLWLLRGNRKRDFLDMSKTETIFNNISVIRSIACGNNAVYRGNKSKIIPNIFVNDELHDNDSIISLLILSYFVKNEARVRKMQLQLIFREIFCKKEIQDSLNRVIRRLLECGVLEECVNEELEDSESELEISPRGQELWGMLVSDSVLLELYREDYFVDDEYPNVNFISSYNLMKNIGQYAIFIQLFIFIDILLEKEKKLHDIASLNNKLIEYHNCFGYKLQTKRLLEGVLKSVEYSGNMNACGVQETVWALKEKMKSID